MDQDVLKSNLNGLERKILMLINEHKNLRDEVKNLKLENQALRQSVQSRDQQLDSFKNQIKIQTVPQLYPLHYHVKSFANKLLEVHNDR